MPLQGSWCFFCQQHPAVVVVGIAVGPCVMQTRIASDDGQFHVGSSFLNKPAFSGLLFSLNQQRRPCFPMTGQMHVTLVRARVRIPVAIRSFVDWTSKCMCSSVKETRHVCGGRVPLSELQLEMKANVGSKILGTHVVSDSR